MSTGASARRTGRFAVLIVAGVLAHAAIGCGGDDRASRDTRAGAPVEGKRGGTLVALWGADTDNIDPGITYSEVGTQIVRATQKTLFTPKVDDASVVEPDLAAARPEISADGCRVTVTLRRGVRFSPPVDREVTSADVKYAIERGFFGSVNNGYAGVYFGSLRGARLGADPGRRIAGVMTPDEHTIVFNLEPRKGSSRCAGGILAAALSMPLSAPVPREYATRFDAKLPSRYGAHQVATGPYMIENDPSGIAVGYEPARRIRLVRNPNWNAQTDSRPAYVDEIEIREGNYDATVLSRRVLEGENMINGDQPPPPAVLQRALANRKDFADPQTFLDPTFNGDHIRPAGNANFSQLDDPDLNERMHEATLPTDPTERAHAWAEIDKEITRLAPAIPWQWPALANLRSKNVVGTIDEDTAVWSLAHTQIR
jgi:peptide/nickel transport system substrate-binding protein